MESALWGIDLGGTKIEGVVLSSADPLNVICRRRIPTEAERGYEHIVRRVHELIDLICNETGLPFPGVLGIGTPGTVDPSTGRMKNCNTVSLNGSSLPEDLRNELSCQVTIANDANCFALAEALFGSARDYPTVFGVILGTGVGGGIVIDGQVLVGAQGIAGEWGHMTLEPDGEPCYCGRRGCVETVISGPALERWYAERAGVPRSLPDIVSLQRERNDRVAAETVERLCVMFGRALGQVVNVVDPHAIVLGGGVGNIDELYTNGVDELAQNVFNDHLGTQVLRPMLGDSAGVFGAAALGRVTGNW